MQASSQNRSRYLRNSIILGCTLALMSQAQAVPQGAFWAEVDNSPGFTQDLTGPASSLTGFRTFDLFVQLEAGDSVTHQDSGLTGGNKGIRFHQDVGPTVDFYQHITGSDTQSEILGFNNNVEWDTRGQMGDLGVGEYAELAPITWDPNKIIGAWEPTGATAAHASADGFYWFGRFSVTGFFTLSYGPMYGEIFVSGTGPNGDFGMPDDLDSGIVPFGVPTPGPFAVLTIAGAFASRRKRINT